MLLWPGLLALRALPSPRRKLLSVLFFLALAVPIAISEHDSSQVGLVASLLVLLLAWVSPRAVVRGLAIAWCLGFVLVIPLDFLAFKADLHQAKWLPMSARARIIIWEYTAERVLEKPFLGIGADSTPAMMVKPKNPSERPKGFVIRRTTGQHAHNLFLQSWYELGVFGVIPGGDRRRCRRAAHPAVACGGASLRRGLLHHGRRHCGFCLGHVADLADLRRRALASLPPHAGSAAAATSRRRERARVSMTRERGERA